jgi:hypothetical protein
MNNIRFFNAYLILALLCSISIPTQAADLNQKKKSFSRYVHQFLACLKGDKECSTQSVKVVRAGTALWILISLIATPYIYRYYKSRKKDKESGISFSSEDISTSTISQPSPKKPTLSPADTNLFDAIKSADIAKATSALKQQANLEAIHYGIDRPLHIAVKKANPRMVELLIENGALVNAVNAENHTPLALAQDALDNPGRYGNPNEENMKQIITLLKKAGAKEQKID